MRKALISLLLAALLLPAAAPDSAEAAWANPKKMKKWSEEDRVLARSFDVWMTDEELDIFMKLKTSEERRKFLTDTGYMKRWDDLDEEIRPKIAAGELEKGLTQDHVYMILDKPQKIRKDFRRDAYVDVLYYDFELDRKGNFFVSPPESATAYKNELVEFLVVLHNGRVFWFGEKAEYRQSQIFDDLARALEAEQQARDAANQAAFDAGKTEPGDEAAGAGQTGDEAAGEKSGDEAAGEKSEGETGPSDGTED